MTRRGYYGYRSSRRCGYKILHPSRDSSAARLATYSRYDQTRQAALSRGSDVTTFHPTHLSKTLRVHDRSPTGSPLRSERQTSEFIRLGVRPWPGPDAKGEVVNGWWACRA